MNSETVIILLAVATLMFGFLALCKFDSINIKKPVRNIIIIIAILIVIFSLSFYFINLDKDNEGIKVTPTINNNEDPTSTPTLEKEEVVSLYDLKCLSSEGSSTKVNYNIVDNIGNTYSKGLQFIAYFSGFDYNIEYYTKKEFNYIEGMIALSESSKDTDGEFVIEIYADEECKYSSPVIKAGSLPIDFGVDITDADKVKIQCNVVVSDGYGTRVNIVNCKLYTNR